MLVLCGMDGNDPDTLHFAAGDHAVSIALAVARHFADCAGLSPAARVRLAIIVEELVVNIVEHGDAPGCRIILALRRQENGISLILRDEARYFDPRLATPPFGVPERGGGVGLALVAAWARIIHYGRHDGVNHLELYIPDEGLTETDR